MKKKIVELPLGKPFYSAYHFQGVSGAVLPGNPSIRNWYINEAMLMNCNKVFLYGFSSPHMSIPKSSWIENPHLERQVYPTRFMNGYIHKLIRELIDHGYYVNFDNIDDYYLEGKSWYGKRHFCHDGMICGYNDFDKTYKVYAYDSNWVYRTFPVSEKSFDLGRQSMYRENRYGTICGVRTTDIQIDLNPEYIYIYLCMYLDSSLEKYPMEGEGDVLGTVVHEYIALYVDKLYSGEIPYEKMDWRVFRVIWEHKAFMLERLQKTEKLLGLDNCSSEAYKPIVEEANTMRMLYASHHKKRRDSVLPIIKSKLLAINDLERKILFEFVKKMEVAMGK